MIPDKWALSRSDGGSSPQGIHFREGVNLIPKSSIRIALLSSWAGRPRSHRADPEGPGENRRRSVHTEFNQLREDLSLERAIPFQGEEPSRGRPPASQAVDTGHAGHDDDIVSL